MARRDAVRTVGLLLVIGCLAPTVAHAQIFVYPRRPDKTQVRYYDFDWQHIDLLVGPEADTSEADRVDPRVKPPGVDPGALPPVRSQAMPEAWSPSPGHWHELLQARGLLPAEGDWHPRAGEREGSGAAASTPQAAAPPAGGEAETPSASPKPEEEAKTTDLNTTLGDRSGGVRLYFYERERPIAERAAGFITNSYRYLVDAFHYVPTSTFPYILYSTYQEFLQTNLFPLQEGVLGVTSPKDLKLTLPYFGDHRLFEEVGTHEMVHQFTIQKLRTVAAEGGLWGDPIESMPLWFIEGLAEFYAQRGLDPEAEMLVRDIVVNPDFYQGYAMLDFFEDRPYSVLWTYKVGQVRCAFLEETYGEGTLQGILEQSALLVGAVGTADRVRGFPALIEHITGDKPRVVSAKFERWLKQRSFRTFIAADQSASTVEPLEEWKGYLNAMVASPSGNLLAYRSIDPGTGRSRLYLVDPRLPSRPVKVVTDGAPGAESLHPIARRNFDLTDEALVYVAEANGRDLLYWQSVQHRAEKPTEEKRRRSEYGPTSRSAEWGAPPGTVFPGGGPPPRVAEEIPWDVEIDLGPRVRYALADEEIVGIDSPTLSPDGRRLAFVGLRMDGLKDLYLLEPSGEGYRLTQLTDDVWAERQAAWGPEGVVFTSDATSHGKYNLFLADPDHPGDITRLTSEARDHLDPEVLPDGRVFFVAYDHARADLHEVVDGRIMRRTDIDTGLFSPAPGPDGGVWALWHHAGQRRPVRVAQADLLSIEGPERQAPEQPRELPHASLQGSKAYEPFSARNWELANVFGFFGAGNSGVYGQVLASATDRLRNHGLLLNLFVVGSFDLTDGYLLYVNQEDRVAWGAGLFQSLTLRIDQTFPAARLRFQSWERFFGTLGSVRYPFNTFQYVQADLALGGVRYFVSAEDAAVLASPLFNGTGRDLLAPWQAANGRTRAQAEGSLRFGHDTIRYHQGTGPIAGSSFLAEVSATVQPFENEAFGRLRIDAEHYIPVEGRANILFRGGAGTSYGGRLARQYYLSSFDTIRGVPFGDDAFLLGKHFLFTTAEFQFPLNSIIRFILFQDIEGIVGADFGMVGNDFTTILDKRVLNLVLGANFGFGPLLFRLHFAKPFDIGADPQEAGVNRGLPNGGRWVTNFSLGWLYF